jgi:hypothetical protein
MLMQTNEISKSLMMMKRNHNGAVTGSSITNRKQLDSNIVGGGGFSSQGLTRGGINNPVKTRNKTGTEQQNTTNSNNAPFHSYNNDIRGVPQRPSH